MSQDNDSVSEAETTKKNSHSFYIEFYSKDKLQYFTNENVIKGLLTA
jgi:hypothetical protein